MEFGGQSNKASPTWNFEFKLMLKYAAPIVKICATPFLEL